MSTSDYMATPALRYFIIRQAAQTARRKFYRELDEAGKKKIAAPANR